MFLYSFCTVSVQAFRHDMKYLTRYAIIVIATLIIKQLNNKIVHVINNAEASNDDMECFTRYAITVIAMSINIIKLFKYKIDPVINNTKATNEINKVFTL